MITFFTLNLFIAICYLVLKVTQNKFFELKVHYKILTFIICLTFAHPWIPKNNSFKPMERYIDNTPFISKINTTEAMSDQISNLNNISSISSSEINLNLIINFIFYAVLCLGLLKFIIDFKKLILLRSRSQIFKITGRVHIYISDEILVPFSYWLPRHYGVILPSTLVSNSNDFKIAVLHELQHHRQKDTKWIHILTFLKNICWMNPFIHLWTKWITEIQEFACDKTLVDQNKVNSQQYARCLIDVAQNTINQRRSFASAAGLRFLVEPTLLKRRIEKMLTNEKKGRSIGWSLLSLGLTSIILCLTAYATTGALTGTLQDRQVDLNKIQALVEKISSTNSFPIVVNDLVLKQLNHYIGTEDGRYHMRKSLKRMKIYQAVIEGKIKEYGLPLELMAIPIIESGYQNLSPKRDKSNQYFGRGAGLWMFIEQSARNYGMRVDSIVDDRLDIIIETDAAMRYLKSNKLLFNDWLLSVLAYNVGENKVQRAIDRLGTKDAWTLIRNGIENDGAYLAKVVSAVIIMKNPELIE